MKNNPFIAYPICSLVYVTLLLIVNFSKERVKTIETKIFTTMTFVNVFALFGELMCYIGVELYKVNEIAGLVILKGYIIILLLWLMIFNVYNILITHKNHGEPNFDNVKYTKKVGLISLIFFLIGALIMAIAPLEVYNDGISKYTYGLGVYILTIFHIILIFVWLIRFLINYKNIKNKKYVPLITFIILIALITFLQSVYREMLLLTSVETLICILMFHTIENPDMKLIKELNIAKDQAEKANKAKTDFLSNMSHEIRTPLNAIIGFSHTLEEENLSEQGKSDVKNIITAGENLIELVNGILDISKIEANKVEIIENSYNFKTLFNDCVALTNSRLNEKQLDFKYSYDETIPEYLYGDASRIKQIIINLLTNAVKYTKEGHIDFKISSVKINEKIRLIISVEDTGIGIKKENIEKLFTKFERLGVEKHTTSEGTGLGLAITKKLIELMGGNIIVQSEFGKGSKFTVSIDQSLVSAEEIEKLKKEKETSIEEIIDANGKRILLVDDNTLNIKVAERLLKIYNVEITSATSGIECLEIIKENKNFDLILLDDMMPKMSGKETFIELQKQENFNIPVVALTANAITGMKEEYLNLGFNDYLSKPIEKKELNRVIKKYLSKE